MFESRPSGWLVLALAFASGGCGIHSERLNLDERQMFDPKVMATFDWDASPRPRAAVRWGPYLGGPLWHERTAPLESQPSGPPEIQPPRPQFHPVPARPVFEPPGLELVEPVLPPPAEILTPVEPESLPAPAPHPPVPHESSQATPLNPLRDSFRR